MFLCLRSGTGRGKPGLERVGHQNWVEAIKTPTALWLAKMMVSLGDRLSHNARVSIFLVLSGKYKIESLHSGKSI